MSDPDTHDEPLVLTDEEVAYLAKQGPTRPTAFRALALEVQEHRQAAREADERLHRQREEAAGRPIAKRTFKAIRSVRIQPEPESGAEGLNVYFGEDGRTFLEPVAFPDSRFTLSAPAALQLADLINENARPAFALALSPADGGGASAELLEALKASLAAGRKESA